MIEIKRTSGAVPNKEYQLFVDAVLVERGYIFNSPRENSQRVFASLYESDDSARLAAHLFKELPPELQEVHLRLDLDWPETVHEVEVSRRQEDKGSFDLGFKFEFGYEDWKGNYSFAEYAEAFSQAVHETRNSGVTWEPDDEESLANGFWIRFTRVSSNSSIIAEVTRCSGTLRVITNAAQRQLEASFIEDSLVVSFDFPEEVKVPCEQYLLYFVQFLKDLGVEATSSLEHQAGQVLFSVTPTNEKDALDKIRDTLDLYLRFPSSPISDISNEPIAVQRLEANILHLRSDLKLAAAELQAKNATIQAQQLTIDIQKGILTGEIVVDSIRNVTPKAEDKEPLLGGIVALATLKERGVEVNLGELLRKLKRKFSTE